MATRRIDLDEVRDALGQEVAEYVREVATELVNQLRVEAPVGATGDLRRSIQILYDDAESGEVIVGVGVDYALGVARGKPPHRPDFEKIEIWARRKLGDEDAAGAVWTHIRQEGTEANPFDRRAVENTIEHFRV